MAEPVAAERAPAQPDREDQRLSDEEIQQLLNEAETRLRNAETEQTTLSVPPKTTLPRLKTDIVHAPYIQERSGVAQADPKLMINGQQRKLADQLRTVNTGNRSEKMNDQLSTGPDWFNMPKTVVTPQLKRDLQLLEMRSVLDPHRHYKKDSRKGKIPTFSQVGTVIEGPTEWYSSRINKKERSKNFVEEAMATERQSGRFKRKYGEIQSIKTSGKKAHYKTLMAKRKKS